MAMTREQILASPGFRQFDPGVFTNDAGQFFDANGNEIAPPGQKPGIAQSDDPTGPGYQGGNNPPGYTGYGPPPTAPPPDTGPTATTGPAPSGLPPPTREGGPTSSSGPTPTLPSAPNAPAFTPPPAFHYDDFTAPDPNSLTNDPRYKFSLGQGLMAIGHKNAATGTLNTGGTLGDYVGFAENLANTSYKDLYNQDFTTYQANRANAFDTYKTNYGIGKDVYDTNYKTQYADPFANANTIGMEQYGAAATNYASGVNQGQFSASLGQNASQFGQTLAQQDKIAQEQFGLSYAQLNAQQKMQADALAQNNSQFTAGQKQNQGQFDASMGFNKWLEDYKRSVLDPFDQKYKTLGLL